ncbi:MAG: dihydropteroate synthase [Gemmatimonadota bacterium]
MPARAVSGLSPAGRPAPKSRPDGAGARAVVGAEGLEWRLGESRLALQRPAVIGILNVTPDSFSDGGLHLEPGPAVERAWTLLEEGADVVDVGAESSRPGAAPVALEEEWSRLAPVLDGLRSFPLPLSVDTTKAEVARRALAGGVSAINDISGLRREPAIGELAAEAGAGLILMHMRGEPRTMQRDTRYDDLVGEVRSALAASLDEAVRRGCHPTQVVLDPGIGFGKSLEGNLELLARVGELGEIGRPILVGPSRKSFLGEILGLPRRERVEGTVAACVAALLGGARLFRVHDVGAVRRALEVAERCRRAGRERG